MSIREPEIGSNQSSENISRAGTPSKINKDETVSKKEPEIKISSDSLDKASAPSIPSLNSKISTNIRGRIIPDV
jgi:hypothetical protein